MSPSVPKPKRKPQRKRFASRRDPAFMAWIHTQPCIIVGRTWNTFPEHYSHEAHRCCTPIEGCHVRSRGAGGDDRENLVPMCGFVHQQQHSLGIRSFEHLWGINVKQIAKELWRTYLLEHGEDAA